MFAFISRPCFNLKVENTFSVQLLYGDIRFLINISLWLKWCLKTCWDAYLDRTFRKHRHEMIRLGFETEPLSYHYCFHNKNLGKSVNGNPSICSTSIWHGKLFIRLCIYSFPNAVALKVGQEACICYVSFLGNSNLVD